MQEPNPSPKARSIMKWLGMLASSWFTMLIPNKVLSQASDKAPFLTPHTNYVKLFASSLWIWGIPMMHSYSHQLPSLGYISPKYSYSQSKRGCIFAMSFSVWICKTYLRCTGDVSITFMFPCMSTYVNLIWSTPVEFSLANSSSFLLRLVNDGWNLILTWTDWFFRLS